jgi:hypothetical protein
VTVVQHLVHTNYARNAKVAFFATTSIVGLLIAAVLVSSEDPTVAVLLGGLVGAMVGACVAVVVRLWPVVRMLWWWATEIACLFALVWLFTLLSRGTKRDRPGGCPAATGGLAAGIPHVRRTLAALGWCVITRHRLRVCFNDVIKSNQHGSLPLILWARPTAVGERVWIFLRPGLSKTDLANRLEAPGRRLLGKRRHRRSTRRQRRVPTAGRQTSRRPNTHHHLTAGHNLSQGHPQNRPPPLAAPPPALVPSGLDLDATPLVAYKPSSAQAAKKPAATADTQTARRRKPKAIQT